MTPAPAEIARQYLKVSVLPGHNSPFGPGNSRWDGRFLDTVYREAKLPSTSFADTSNALTVLTQTKNLRGGRFNQPVVGDAVFLAHGGYVGIVLDAQDKTYLHVLVGWWPGGQGTRTTAVRRLHRTLDVLAVADPRMPVKTRNARPHVTVTDEEMIASLLSTHPAVGVHVSPSNFRSAYARWQRHLGYPVEKVNGVPDEKSLDILTREERR